MDKRPCGRRARTVVFVLLCFALGFLFAGSSSALQINVAYLYKLAGDSGGIPFDTDARITVDKWHNEVYVLDDGIRIFNSKGMEVYHFAEGGALAGVGDVAVDENSVIYVLMPDGIGACDFRGELQSKIVVKGLPAGFSGFQPSRLLYVKGHFYLVDTGRMLVAVTDMNGNCEKSYELSKLMLTAKEQAKYNYVSGSWVDEDGNMFFTVPTVSSAFRVEPDGKSTRFGRGGGGPGRFGVAYDITVAADGHIYISDRLHSCILIFGKDLEYIAEFGFRGIGPGGMIAPSALATGPDGNLYITQGASQGISVYNIAFN